MSGNLIKVAVIMSTYNGEKYLKEQIDSILAQNDVDVKLFIRDDGSKDKTPDIINEYVEKYDNVVFWNKDNVVNLGVRDSFLTLLKEVCDKYTEINYFAFADQDDVWKIDKLSAAVGFMREQNPDEDRPTLYYSNKTFVDDNLHLIKEEHIKYFNDFYDILWPSLAYGCTMVMNRPLVNLTVSEMPTQYRSLHDAWIYRLAILCGAVVVFDTSSHILYRQHGDNICGKDASTLVRKKSIFNLFSRNRFMRQAQIKEYIRLHEKDISLENRKYIEWVMNYHKSFSAWCNLAFCPLARKRGVVLYSVWLIKLILRKI